MWEYISEYEDGDGPERFGQLIENPPVEAGRLCAPRSGYRALRKASLVDNCNPPTVKH